MGSVLAEAHGRPGYQELQELLETIPSNQQPKECEWLYNLASALPLVGKSGMETRCLEIGTADGRMTAVIAAATSGVVLGIDNRPGKAAAARAHMERLGLQDRVTIIDGTSPDDLPDGPFDLIYIDGHHIHPQVGQDIAASIQRLKVGGWLTGHDYKHPTYLDVRASVEVLVFWSGLFGWEWGVQIDGRNWAARYKGPGKGAGTLDVRGADPGWAARAGRDQG